MNMYKGMQREYSTENLVPGHSYRVRVASEGRAGRGPVSNLLWTLLPRQIQ